VGIVITKSAVRSQFWIPIGIWPRAWWRSTGVLRSSRASTVKAI